MSSHLLLFCILASILPKVKFSTLSYSNFSNKVDEMDTIAYMLFVCDIISGLVFVLFSSYIFFRVFRETAQRLTRKLSRLGSQIMGSKVIGSKVIGSKILTEKIRQSLRLNINTHQQLNTLVPPPALSPTSLHFDGFSDPPMSSERIVSTDRPFSPFINIRRSESIQQQSDYSPSSERRGNSFTELPIFSPTNMTGAELLTFSLRPPRGLTIPMSGADTPGEDQLSEILKDEMINSPPRSVENKTSKVLKFSQESWTEILSSKKRSKFSNQ